MIWYAQLVPQCHPWMPSSNPSEAASMAPEYADVATGRAISNAGIRSTNHWVWVNNFHNVSSSSTWHLVLRAYAAYTQ